MEGIAIVRKWIDDGKPAVNPFLHQAIFKSERVLDQLRSVFERSCHTMERSRVLHAEMERVLEQSKRTLLASERKRNG
jgi:flagellar biosynthesis/type III secretory pathway chaperone